MAIERNLQGSPVNSDTNSRIPATSSNTAKRTGIILLLFPNRLFTDLPN